MLYAVELYDIVFFDWVLLCHSGFFPHFYPELKGVVGPHMFGYNKRTHILHCLLDIPAAAAAAAPVQIRVWRKNMEYLTLNNGVLMPLSASAPSCLGEKPAKTQLPRRSKAAIA